MRKPAFIDSQYLVFSARLCEDRLERAQKTFGSGVLQRILCFALYLLGVNRRGIGLALDIPSETAKSIIKAVNRDGLSALEDRRRRFSNFLPQATMEPSPVTLRQEEGYIVINFGVRGTELKLCQEDPLQLKTVLLSMLNSGLLSKQQVAEAIKLTPAHTATLARRLHEQGALSLVDRRQGQKQDYRVPPTVKAELIQQFAVDVINTGRTSGTAISAGLKKRCNIVVPARTVRHHLARMGLGKIKGVLPQLVSATKKIPASIARHEA